MRRFSPLKRCLTAKTRGCIPQTPKKHRTKHYRSCRIIIGFSHGLVGVSLTRVPYNIYIRKGWKHLSKFTRTCFWNFWWRSQSYFVSTPAMELPAGFHSFQQGQIYLAVLAAKRYVRLYYPSRLIVQQPWFKSIGYKLWAILKNMFSRKWHPSGIPCVRPFLFPLMSGRRD